MGNIQSTNWTIPGNDGQPIYGSTDQGPFAKKNMRGELIICHGFKGYKDYGMFLPLSMAACGNGLTVHRFNFSHSGMTNNIETFEKPDLFEKDRWGRQVEDLAAVIEYVRQHSDKPIVVFGHSRGGVTSTLFAGTHHRDAGLAGLITAAAPDYAENLDDLIKDQLRAEGRLLSPSGRTGQNLYVGIDWLEEIERDPELYDPVLAAGHVKCPTLIVHGDEDPTVSVDCAHNLHKAATPNSRLEIIEGANHVFNCPNPALNSPYTDLPEQTRKLIELSVVFAVTCCEQASA